MKENEINEELGGQGKLRKYVSKTFIRDEIVLSAAKKVSAQYRTILVRLENN